MSETRHDTAPLLTRRSIGGSISATSNSTHRKYSRFSSLLTSLSVIGHVGRCKSVLRNIWSSNQKHTDDHAGPGRAGPGRAGTCWSLTNYRPIVQRNWRNCISQQAKRCSCLVQGCYSSTPLDACCSASRRHFQALPEGAVGTVVRSLVPWIETTWYLEQEKRRWWRRTGSSPMFAVQTWARDKLTFCFRFLDNQTRCSTDMTRILHSSFSPIFAARCYA